MLVSVTSRNGIETSADRAGFWHGGFLRSILHCVKRVAYFLLNSVLKSGLEKVQHEWQVDRRNVLST